MIQVALPPYSIVYEIDEISEIGEQYDNSEDIKQLTEAIKELNQHLSEIHETVESEEGDPEEDPSQVVEEEDPEPTEVEKKLESIEKSITEINEREKAKDQAEAEQESIRAAEELNNSKSSSTNLWTGQPFMTNKYISNVNNNYEIFNSNAFDIYKFEYGGSLNFVFSYSYIGSRTDHSVRIVFYDSSDNVITGLTNKAKPKVESRINFTTPVGCSYFYISLVKDSENVSLYSDTIGRTNIVHLDETADTHMYLTTPVENASINDVYTLSLSIRNLLLVFFLFWLSLKIFGLLRAAIERVMNR